MAYGTISHQTLLNSIKSFTYFFDSRFHVSWEFNYSYTRVWLLITSYASRNTRYWPPPADAVRPPASYRFIRVPIARPIHCHTALLYAVNGSSVYIRPPRASLMALALLLCCWSRHADLNVQNCRKWAVDRFSIFRKRHPKCSDSQNIFPFFFPFQLSALFFDTDHHCLGRLALSSATAVAKIWHCWCRVPGFRLVFRSFFFYHGRP